MTEFVNGIVVLVVGFALGYALKLLLTSPARLSRLDRYRRRNQKCTPNVIAGYENRTEVLQWSCGDAVCRCGGTKQRGYLDQKEEQP